MALYSRHQLLVLVGLIALFGAGLAVDRWRRAHPEAVERIERAADAGAGEAPAADPASARGLAPRPSKLHRDAGARGIDPIDLNRATVDDLRRLPGVGAGLAARIIEARDAAPFTSVEGLRRVRGVGAATLERLRPLVTARAP